MKKLLLSLAIIVLISVLVLGGCAKPVSEAKTIKVGVIWGLTGPGSFAQLMWRDATLLCQDWINDKGGITVQGEKYLLKCIIEDNKMSPAGSVDAANKLVHQDQVKFIIGSVIPVQADAIASVTEPNKVLYVAAKTDRVHPDRPLSFCGTYSLSAPIPLLYEVLLELYPNVKKMGYIVEDEPGARAVAELSQNIARGHGLTVIAPQLHPWESTEYYPQWTRLLADKPDAMDNGLKMPDNVANCVRQGRELGFTGPMFSAVGGGVEVTLNMIGKEFANDFLWSAYDPYGPEAPPNVKEVVSLWDNTYDYRTDGSLGSGWNPLWVLAQAIEQAQSLDPTIVAQTWEKMETIETLTGKGRMGGAKVFGSNHIVFDPVAITRLQNGQAEFIKWVDPWMP